MEIGIYSSPLIIPGLVACIGAGILLLKQHKDAGTLLLLLGFVIVTVTQFPINYCVGLAVLNVGVTDYPILCNSITPHIKGIGYVLIAYGIAKLAQSLKQNA